MTNLSRRWWHRPAAVAAVVMIGTGIVRTNERHPSAPAAAQAPPHSETPPPPLFSNAAPVRSCESLREVSLANVTIDAATTDEATGACRVTATVTHPPAQDAVKIWIALPAKNWNGRFQGVGGGGFSGGSENGVRAPLDLGYAAGSTDTGHTGGSGSFALDANNRLNWVLIRDNAYLGIHEMTLVGKALVEAFYGKAPRYSYFNGCSTGGRQGLMEAQRYPADYNGILSGAPAINWTKLHPEQLWGHLVMLEAHDVLPMCKLNAAAAAAIAACDPIDGVKDGVIDDPKRCTYDPKALVGTATEECGALTEVDAEVIRKIWEGPRRRDGSFLWYGLQRGAPFALSATGGTPPTGHPFPITVDWFRYFLTQNPQWDWTTITHARYEQLWDQSVEEFSDVLATDDANLMAFRDAGGKILLWHGWADPLIYPEGTIDYYKRVQGRMGGSEATATFARLFMAPGVGHCGGGDGPMPSGVLSDLVRWVEMSLAPETLTAIRRDPSGAILRSRPICQYPFAARYRGTGSTDDAANFGCPTRPPVVR